MCVKCMTTSRFIYAFTCLKPEEFSQMLDRGLNISLSGKPSDENICSRETDKQREPVDRLTPPKKKKKKSGFTQNGSDSFTSKLYIAIDRWSRIKASRGVLGTVWSIPIKSTGRGICPQVPDPIGGADADLK